MKKPKPPRVPPPKSRTFISAACGKPVELMIREAEKLFEKEQNK